MSTASLRVAIIGGGASGALAALHLLKSQTHFDITVFEPSDRIGFGLAYSTLSPHHLLNVPVEKMSADSRIPDDFVNWCSANHSAFKASQHYPFVPRSWFGAYLEQTLNASIISKDQNAASNSASFRHFKEKLVHLSYKLKRSSWQVTTSHRTESFDRVILATGFHSHMQTPAELNALQPTERWIAQPFQIVDFKDVAKESQILIVGSGLTAIDCWRSLRGNGHTGHITMLSRHGRLPLPQFTNSPLLSTDQKLAERATPRELFSLARKLNAEGVSWQDFANLLRPSVQRHWQDWSTSERGQFTRHIKHWWDLIRHRVPPSVFAELQSDIKQGRLVVAQGRIVSSVVANDRAVVSSHVSNQHTTKLNQLECDLVIIATGANVDRSNLLATPQLSNGAYAIGPAAKDQLWEITAIPEIREQVEAIVKQLEIQSQ